MASAQDPAAALPMGTTTRTAPVSQQSEAAVGSRVADHDYPNVPDTTEGQQAATDPASGGGVSSAAQQGETPNVPFKEQVNGYAKKFAGAVFGNKDEKEFGEAKLRGEA